MTRMADHPARRVIGCVALLIVSLVGTMAAAERVDTAAVTVSVYDYAQIPHDILARAQKQVSAYYRSIDIETRWGKTLRPPIHVDGAPQVGCDADRLTIIILNR